MLVNDTITTVTFGRLQRIEGQARGLRRMVENGAPVGAVLVQIAATVGALDGLRKLLLAETIEAAVRSGDVEQLAGLEGLL